MREATMMTRERENVLFWAAASLAFWGLQQSLAVHERRQLLEVEAVHDAGSQVVFGGLLPLATSGPAGPDATIFNSGVEPFVITGQVTMPESIDGGFIWTTGDGGILFEPTLYRPPGTYPPGAGVNMQNPSCSAGFTVSPDGTYCYETTLEPGSLRWVRHLYPDGGLEERAHWEENGELAEHYRRREHWTFATGTVDGG
jgi:hypothetical protein